MVDLLAERRKVSDLPCLHNLSVAKMSDDRLVDAEGPARTRNTAELSFRYLRRREPLVRHDEVRHSG